MHIDPRESRPVLRLGCRRWRPAAGQVRPGVLLTLGFLLAVGAVVACTGSRTTEHSFQRDVSVEVAAGDLSESVSFDAPEDRRLVLEYVSGSVRVADEELVRVNVQTTVDGDGVTHTIPNHAYHRDFDPPTTDDFVVTWGQAVRIHADPGTQVRVTATRSENVEITPTHFQLAVSGRLIECGSGSGCPLP